MSECIRHTDLPHTTRLFADLVYHFDRVRGFYAYAPYDPESFRTAAPPAAIDGSHRAALVAALEQENRDAGPAAQRHLDLLSQSGTVAVTSGQQVGLYTGPVFTIYKALTAARLAADLTARGQPAVPVFWLATEDHDLEEIHHAWVFDAANQPIRLQATAAAQPHQPVGGVRIEDPAGELLRQALSGLPFGEQVSEWAAEAYAGGVTFGGAFKTLLRRLLAPYGVLLLDPLSPAVRRLAAPLMSRAIRGAPDLTAALLERGAALDNAGYHAQVHMEDKTSLFFLVDQGRRTHLRRAGDAYAGDGGEARTTAQLLHRLDGDPEAFSPNALLRPVVQDYLLPTVAYIGGPAELAYLAQSEVLYRRLLGRMPVALPRAGFTILDARVEKLLHRYRLRVLDVLEGGPALEQRIAGALIPPAVHDAFAQSRQQIRDALDAVDTHLQALDPTLAASLAGSRRKIEYQFSKIEAKTARETLRRAGRARQDAACLVGLIFPEKTLQERLYSVLPFLARHGPDLIDRLHGAIHLNCPDHQVLVA